jgi:ferredoxin
MFVFRIGIFRRFVQMASLVLLVYGAYIFKRSAAGDEPKALKNLLPELRAPANVISTTKFQRGNILWPSGATPVIEIFPPGLVCRFNPEGGLFKACVVHFISENLTWQTPVRYLLPHITLFILLCFLFGRMWCGWVCPIGTVGDCLTWLRRKMNVHPGRFPAGFRRGLHFSSYGMLGVSYAISALIGFPNLARFQCYWFLPYCQICPARLICPVFGLIRPSWKDFSTAITSTFTILAWLVLLLFIAAFYWGRRVWCHLCPVGLMNSWFNKGCAVELHKRAERCNKCASCADACPMGLSKMYSAEKDLIYNQRGCIMCLRCVEVCPQNDCLSFRYLGAKIISSRFSL